MQHMLRAVDVAESLLSWCNFQMLTDGIHSKHRGVSTDDKGFSLTSRSDEFLRWNGDRNATGMHLRSLDSNQGDYWTVQCRLWCEHANQVYSREDYRYPNSPVGLIQVHTFASHTRVLHASQQRNTDTDTTSSRCRLFTAIQEERVEKCLWGIYRACFEIMLNQNVQSALWYAITRALRDFHQLQM